MIKLPRSIHVISEETIMKKALIRKTAVIAAAALLLVLMPAAVFADSGGYTTEAFDVNIVTDEDHVFHVTETIKVDFNEQRHGIYRYIPNGGRQYAVKRASVEGHEYEVYTENNSTVIKIGSADHTVYGDQEYRITYDIVGYKDSSENGDALAIDLIPTGWGTAIESAKATITFPKRIEHIEVYAGQYEEAGDQGYFLVSDDGMSLTAVSRDTVPAGAGLTIRADLPEGYWVDPFDRTDGLPAAYGVLGALAALMLGLWFAVGRDKAVIKPVEFYPPDGMDPLQISYIANDTVAAKDTAAMFMYYAGKGYLKVIQEDKKKFSLKQLRDADRSEKTHSRILLRKLFSEGSEVQLKHLPSGFGEAVAGIEKDVKASFDRKMQPFTRGSKAGRAVGTAVCVLIPLIAGLSCTYMGFAGLIMAVLLTVIALCIGLFSRRLIRQADTFAGKKKPAKLIADIVITLALILIEAGIILQYFPLLAAVFAASTLVALLSTMFVRQRVNNDLYGRVMGFREFIETAERDRLRLLAEQDPEYYFNVMPYAYVFSISNKWADKFADFRIPQPSWYDGDAVFYDPFFPTRMFAYSSSSISGCVREYYEAIGADMVKDIGSSGGGGGGSFSGGGFGGGGGGSW